MLSLNLSMPSSGTAAGLLFAAAALVGCGSETSTESAGSGGVGGSSVGAGGSVGQGAAGGEGPTGIALGEVVPEFSLEDVNETSASFGQVVSPRDYLEQVSGWYFGHAT